MEKMQTDLISTVKFILERKFLMTRLIREINFPSDLENLKKKI